MNMSEINPLAHEAERIIVFDRGNVRFIYRIAGIVLNQNRVLLQRIESDDFWFLPGGRARLLEPAKDTLAREMREELGITVQIERLVWVAENFFALDRLQYHELGFYFLISLPSDCHILGKPGPFTVQDNGVQTTFQWHPLTELATTILYPSFLRQALPSLPETTQHIVHVDEPFSLGK